MKSFFDMIGNVRTTDIMILTASTIPVIAIYLVFTVLVDFV